MAYHAFSRVPALAIGVCGVVLLAGALDLIYALDTVPDCIDWAGASWTALSLVACVLLGGASTFAWALLEGTACWAGQLWFAFSVDDLLHSLVCADHVSAEHAWYWNLLIGLVELTLVVAWAVGFLYALAVLHDGAGRALATSLAFSAAWCYALECLVSQAVAGLVAQAL